MSSFPKTWGWLNSGLQGLCDRDLWDIGGWFLGLMPVMLQRYKEIRHGSSGCLGENYTDTDGILKNDTYHSEWDKILDEMIFLFREATEGTCSRKNPYDDEHTQRFCEFKNRSSIIKPEKLDQINRDYPAQKAMEKPGIAPQLSPLITIPGDVDVDDVTGELNQII